MPCPLYPRGKSPAARWIGSWVDSRASLDTEVAKRKKFLSVSGIEPRSSVRNIVIILSELPLAPAITKIASLLSSIPRLMSERYMIFWNVTGCQFFDLLIYNFCNTKSQLIT
jgi:hypothetical protein